MCHGIRKPQDLSGGGGAVLRVEASYSFFISFEDHKSIFTLNTFHEADHNSNFQAILLNKKKRKQTPNLYLMCQDPAFEGRGSDWGETVVLSAGKEMASVPLGRLTPRGPGLGGRELLAGGSME